MTEEICPVCEMGCLYNFMELVEVTYRGSVGKIPSKHCKCKNCGSEFANNKHASLNKKLMQQYKKYIDSILEGKCNEEI